MSYEEEFDSIMRSKAEEMEYPFEEESWRKASDLLSRNRAGGSDVVRSLLWSAAVVTAGGIATLLWFAPGGQPAAGKTIPAQAASENVYRPTAVAAAPLTKVERNPQSPEPEKTQAPAQTVLHAAIVEINASERASAPEQITSAEPAQNSAAVHTTPDAGSTPEITGLPATDITFVPQSQGGSSVEDVVMETDEVTESMQPKSLYLEYNHDERNISAPCIIVLKGDDDYVSKRRFRRTFFAEAEAGAAFWTGWQNDGAHNGRGINWFGGVAAGVRVCKDWNVTSGLQVFNFAHLEAPFYTATSKSYGFSSVSGNTIITTEELRYIGLPVRIGYSTGGGGQVRAGLIAAQLWYASNRFRNYTTRNGETTESGSGSNNNLYEGMNQQVFMITAGYGVRLSQRVHAGVDVVYGLTDLFSERTYLRRSERPLMIRAGLTFRFLDR